MNIDTGYDIASIKIALLRFWLRRDQTLPRRAWLDTRQNDLVGTIELIYVTLTVCKAEQIFQVRTIQWSVTDEQEKKRKSWLFSSTIYNWCPLLGVIGCSGRALQLRLGATHNGRPTVIWSPYSGGLKSTDIVCHDARVLRECLTMALPLQYLILIFSIVHMHAAIIYQTIAKMPLPYLSIRFRSHKTRMILRCKLLSRSRSFTLW